MFTMKDPKKGAVQTLLAVIAPTILYYGVWCLFISTTLSGCSKRYHSLPVFSPISLTDYPNKSVGRFKTSYLADQVDEYYRGVDPGPIGVTTFVNLDDMESTSSFGRVCSEQLLSELAMKGYEVVELRKGEALEFVQDKGEFMLSRSPALVKRTHSLGAILVGTYTSSEDRVYLNVRLIDPRSAMVLSAGSAEMERTDEIARMLRRGKGGGQLERIPVVSTRSMRVPLTQYPRDAFAMAPIGPYDALKIPPKAKSP